MLFHVGWLSMLSRILFFGKSVSSKDFISVRLFKNMLMQDSVAFRKALGLKITHRLEEILGEFSNHLVY